MSTRMLLVFALLAASTGGLIALSTEALGDARSRRAEQEAVKRGKELFETPWAEGQKTCKECHGRGPNVLKMGRVKAYPKFDREMGKVVSAQQKLNQMIVDSCGGEALELGSEDLNALEAYVSTLR